MLSAGVSGVLLQAGLAPGNSLHDFSVSPVDITQNRCIGPARAGRVYPQMGLQLCDREHCHFRLTTTSNIVDISNTITHTHSTDRY